MSKKIKVLIVASLSLIVVLAGASVGAVSIRTVTSDVPLQISEVSVSNDSGRGVSVLSYTLQNNHNDTLSSAEFRLLRYDRFGHLLGGEGWVIRLAGLERGQSTSLSLPLGHFLAPGQTGVLAVLAVKDSTSRIFVDSSAVHAAATSLVRSGTQPLLLSQAAPLRPETSAATCPGDFCKTSLADATSACGSGGISSFSCSLSACSYSFSCKGPKPIQE